MHHKHSHWGVHHDRSHKDHEIQNYRNFGLLFIVCLVSAFGEFFVALLAHSVAAQTDAIHSALTHLPLYGLTFLIGRHVFIHRMNKHEEQHCWEQFMPWCALLIFLGLAMICYASVVKLLSSEIVITDYMLISASIGLCGNIGMIIILSKIGGRTPQRNRFFWLFFWDACGDFLISAVVFVTACAGLAFPWLPIHIIDPILSLGVAVLIACAGINILRKKTPEHIH